MVDLSSLTENQKLRFTTEVVGQAKSHATGLLLALFLGGFGAHKFYLGKTGKGVMYIIFCWTFIPAIIAFIELFTMKSQVQAYNDSLEMAVFMKLKAMG